MSRDRGAGGASAPGVPAPIVPPPGMLGGIDRAAAGLHPAYFSLVMATGIVSLAAWIQGYAPAAHALFWINLVFFGALWALTFIRIARHRARMVADLNDHTRSVGFFTAVPGSCVLGSEALLIQGAPAFAWTLWIAGVALWVLLTYTIFTALTVKAAKPALAEGLNGGWLVSIVATQSVSVLAAQIGGAAGSEGAAGIVGSREGLLFVALAMWLGGAMLYVWIISLIFYRYTFFPFKPSDLAPPYWINMGAMAISALAGATLILAAKSSPLLRDLLPFIKGATLLFWATATWWIPMLVILGIWRHVVKRFPLRYDPLYWGAVFPLGMYSVATARMAAAIGLPFLAPVSPAFFYIAAGAWAVALVGLLHRLFVSGSRATRA
jgi:tellurite resistance protein TehA-like permease